MFAPWTYLFPSPHCIWSYTGGTYEHDSPLRKVKDYRQSRTTVNDKCHRDVNEDVSVVDETGLRGQLKTGSRSVYGALARHSSLKLHPEELTAVGACAWTSHCAPISRARARHRSTCKRPCDPRQQKHCPIFRLPSCRRNQSPHASIPFQHLATSPLDLPDTRQHPRQHLTSCFHSKPRHTWRNLSCEAFISHAEVEGSRLASPSSVRSTINQNSRLVKLQLCTFGTGAVRANGFWYPNFVALTRHLWHGLQSHVRVVNILNNTSYGATQEEPTNIYEHECITKGPGFPSVKNEGQRQMSSRLQ